MIIPAVLTVAGLGLLLGIGLVLASTYLAVQEDPRIERVTDELPGANCGGCGYVGCGEYAEAVVAGKVSVDKCPVGGVSCAAALAKILGIKLEETWPYRPAVHCGANYDQRLGRREYRGEQTCGAANIISGVQGCTYGCLGLADCVGACSFDAIHIIDGLAIVDYDKCTGCGACARVCPRNIISMVPFKAEKMLIVTCSNKDFGKDVKAVCKVGCIGCKACERTSELFKVDENISRIDYDKYDSAKMGELNVVIEKCPMRRITYVGEPTEKDLAEVAEEQVPKIVQADFKTTVDKTDWHG
ncbi:MAG: RnfABCDGE type electron transport complex subunit B [Phycisphaerae bacterium]|nr:RnfABCDGE type electron transport complex subunit B [Phycisphaerae bacterium]